MTDLELVGHVVARHGARYISQILGDFAFVVWRDATRTAVAACDPFAVNKLYYAQRQGMVAFASRAEALALDDRYEVQYLAEMTAMCTRSAGLSVYAGVRAVPAGTMVVLEGERCAVSEYWSVSDIAMQPESAQSESEAAETCRHLLAESVRLRLTGGKDTWAQLSGGIDSSSIVSIAQWLVERGTIAQGISGTVTYVDRQGTGSDEREYSRAVAGRWMLRNETIVDAPIWYDERYALPHPDQPRFTLPFYPRERRLCAVVQAAGGRVLLSGVGGDELFTGLMLFFADWLAQGRVWPAVREMARRAAIGRVSFWELAYRNAFLPLLPRAVQRRLVRDEGQVPPWLLPAALRRYALGSRAFLASTYAGPVGHKYRHAIVTNLVDVGRSMDFGVIGDVLDVRHPFLYRPLVEFALRLPPELCVRPYARKWLLREAMRGVLPELVRTRVGKGTPTEVFAQSLTTQRRLLEPLMKDPILADLGVVDAAKLRAAFDAAPCQPHSRKEIHATVQSTLMIEAWLQMRSGRWPRGYYFGNAVSA